MGSEPGCRTLGDPGNTGPKGNPQRVASLGPRSHSVGSLGHVPFGLFPSDLCHSWLDLGPQKRCCITLHKHKQKALAIYIKCQGSRGEGGPTPPHPGAG